MAGTVAPITPEYLAAMAGIRNYDDDKRGPMLGRMRRERIEFEAGIRE
jgi:hypothetical protein